MDPARRVLVTHPSGYEGPGFEVAGLLVWGFTAGLLDRLLTLGGFARPWDRGRRRPVPLRLPEPEPEPEPEPVSAAGTRPGAGRERQSATRPGGCDA